MAKRDWYFDLLVLPIKKKWFDMILSGEKWEEYREMKPYWEIRIAHWLGFRPGDEGYMVELVRENLWWRKGKVLFRNGYSKDAPSFVANCSVRIGEGRKELGAEEGKVYFIFRVWEIERRIGCG